MKITTKTTKEQLKSFLGANAKAVKSKDKTLFDQMVYADKMLKKDESKVARKDLVDLVKSVIALLGESIVEPVLAQETPQPQVENSVKKMTSKSGKKVEKATESKEAPKKEEKVDKKSAKKPLGKKDKGDDTVSSKKTVQTTKALELAEVFPEKFEVQEQKYEIARDIANMGQLHDALEKDDNLVFALYWTKRQIKQFGYGVDVLQAPKEFPLDLDLATCIYVSDECIVSYAISMYSESCYMFTPENIEEADNGIRYAGGVEFQIYRVV